MSIMGVVGVFTDVSIHEELYEIPPPSIIAKNIKSTIEAENRSYQKCKWVSKTQKDQCFKFYDYRICLSMVHNYVPEDKKYMVFNELETLYSS